MMPHDSQQELRQAFHEVVLHLAGALFVEQADDKLIWAVCRTLDPVLERWLERGPASADPTPAPAPRRRPHPAVLELLVTINRHAPAEGPCPASAALSDAETAADFIRVPGLFRRWELPHVLEAGADFRLEETSAASDGTPLFAVYRREPNNDKEE